MTTGSEIIPTRGVPLLWKRHQDRHCCHSHLQRSCHRISTQPHENDHVLLNSTHTLTATYSHLHNFYAKLHTTQHWSHYNVESVYYLNWFLSNFGSVLVYIWQTPLSLCIIAKQTCSLRAAVWIASTPSPAIWNNRVTIIIASNQAPPPITWGGTWFEAKIVTCHWIMIIEGVRTRVAFFLPHV